MLQRYKGVHRLIISDWLASSISWFIFFFIRKQFVYKLTIKEAWTQTKPEDFFIIFVIVPLFWFVIYLFTGSYFNIYKKQRIKTLYTTFITSLVGSIILFFVFVINDPNVTYSYFYEFIYKFFLVHYLLTLLFRLIVLTYAKNELKSKKISFHTLIIGSNERAIKIYNDLKDNVNPVGYNCVGFMTATDDLPNGLTKYIQHLGTLDHVSEVIKKYEVEEIYIALESSEHHKLKDIILALSSDEVIIKIDADQYDIIAGMVRTNNLFMSPYIEINPMIMSDWELVLKRGIDIVLSIVSIIILIPLYIFAAIKVKLSSTGPIIYSQKRLGRHGKEFSIYKFRSMFENAEQSGPKLSSDDDPRITPWGKVMRKWRIDEIPQFINILTGDMSFVGPRPERKFYYDQLAEIQPSYKLLLKIRPGITSWGMVKFGYAENTSEMLSRMKYDLLYIKNASIFLDFKIMILTLIVIFQGRGK